jgi:hypothetical protein
MTTETDIELIRRLSPLEDGPSDEARDVAREALRTRLDNERRAGSRSRRHLRLPLLPASIGLVSAAAVAAVVVLLVAGPRGSVVQPESAAAAVLQRAALTAEASGGPRVLRAGEYWYVHSRDTRLGVVLGPTAHPLVIVDARSSEDRQVWIGRGVRSWLSTRAVGPIQFLSASAREQWVRAGRPKQRLGPGNSPLPADAFDMPYKQLIALPTNVDALWQVVKHRAGRGSAAWQRHEMFTVIGDLLREDPVPARVRAALYRVAAKIPGIQLLGLTHDGLGRPALDVALNDSYDGNREELLFDPRTANLLGERTTVVNPPSKFHVRPGTIVYESTYISSGIAEHIGQRSTR